MLLLASSLLSHLATGFKPHIAPRWPRAVASGLSITFRRLGKMIAAFNAIWIVVTCFFQFSNFYDRCYCNSSVFGRRDAAYNIIKIIAEAAANMKAAWIGGTCLAAGTAAIFIGFVVTYINPVLPDELQ
ncbi:hypothetical protein NMY22_g8980 [Coprinellus aureogranulatus]|nr:hypothetical protein NMY22_g8980 [Coprinellus aureogranulatus]